MSATYNAFLDALGPPQSWSDPNSPDYVPVDMTGIETPLANARPDNIPGTQANPNDSTSIGSSASGTDVANMGAAVTTPATGAQAAGSALSAANAGTGVTGDNTTIGKFETWLTSSTGNIVAVLLGLILIAGAIFSFSAVKDTVVGAGKAIVT
jgi:hypothetical protein